MVESACKAFWWGLWGAHEAKLFCGRGRYSGHAFKILLFKQEKPLSLNQISFDLWGQNAKTPRELKLKWPIFLRGPVRWPTENLILFQQKHLAKPHEIPVSFSLPHLFFSRNERNKLCQSCSSRWVKRGRKRFKREDPRLMVRIRKVAFKNGGQKWSYKLAFCGWCYTKKTADQPQTAGTTFHLTKQNEWIKSTHNLGHYITINGRTEESMTEIEKIQ